MADNAPSPPTAGGKLTGGIKGTITQKFGPLPVWGWAVAGVGLYLAYSWWSNRSGASGADTSTQGQDTGALAGSSGIDPGSGGYQYPISTTPPDPIKKGPATFHSAPGGRVWDPAKREWVKWDPRTHRWVHDPIRGPLRAQPFAKAGP